MAIVIKPITVEVSKPNIFQAIAAKQNDSNSRFLNVTIVNEGEKITVLPTSMVTINAKRSDGQSNSFFGEINDDGTVTVPLHSWILELAGYVNCDVSIIDASNRKLTSTTFALLVEEAAHGSDDISEDEQYNILVNLIEEVEEAKEKMGTVPEDAIVALEAATASKDQILIYEKEAADALSSIEKTAADVTEWENRVATTEERLTQAEEALDEVESKIENGDFKGDDGPEGRGILSFDITDENVLIANYTDGSTQEIGIVQLTVDNSLTTSDGYILLDVNGAYLIPKEVTDNE